MLYLRTMLGLGDNIYTRAVVRQLVAAGTPVTLQTPWPQLYADIEHVTCIRPDGTTLRTQAKNERMSSFAPKPHGFDSRVRRVAYSPQDLQAGVPAIDSLFRSLGLHADAPNLSMKMERDDASYAVVRPVTARREWLNEARNPKPEYIAQAAAALCGVPQLNVISVADISGSDEWIVGNPPPAYERYHEGVPIRSLLSLTRSMTLGVAPVGWIVPMSMMFDVPLFCVLGGQLGHNSPDVLTHPAIPHRIRFAKPMYPCYCTDMRHTCEKRIPDFAEQFSDFCSAVFEGTDLVRERRLRPVTLG